MEDRRITYAVSNFSSVNDGDTNQADSDPGPAQEAPAELRAQIATADDRSAEPTPGAHTIKDEPQEPAAPAAEIAADADAATTGTDETGTGEANRMPSTPTVRPRTPPSPISLPPR